MKPIPNAPVKNQCSSDYFYGRDPKLESAINFVENNYGEVVRLLEDGHPTGDGRVNIVLKRFAYLPYLMTESPSRAAISEERRAGNDCICTCRYWCCTYL